MDESSVMLDCASCIYANPVFSDDENKPLLKCFRYPPVIFLLGDQVAQARPDAADWCGEHLSAEEYQSRNIFAVLQTMQEGADPNDDMD